MRVAALCRPADEYHWGPPLWGLCFFFDGFFIEQGKIVSETGAFAASGHVGDALFAGAFTFWWFYNKFILYFI